MGNMGKTISITIPLPLVEELQGAANKVGISRSRFISNLLLKWQDKKNNPTNEQKNEQTIFETKPHDCVNREDDGFCILFEYVCNTTQEEANTCSGYVKNKERKI